MNRAPGRLALVACLFLGGLMTTRARATDTVVYYHTDALRSVAVVTNATGQVIERTYYAPYGAVLKRPLRDGPGYTGHREDAETGLVYMQQRYYDPETGRFLSADPVPADGDGGSFNRYWYANNNPYRYTDPDGRCTGSHISNKDGTCASSGDFTTRASNAHLVGASASQRGAILGISHASQTNATTSVGRPKPIMLASNSPTDKSVRQDEAKNAVHGFADAYTELVEHGVIGTSGARFLAAAGARAASAGVQAHDIGTLFAGLAKITLTDGPVDIGFYIMDGRGGPTGRYYQGSLINWGKADWRPFDPGLRNSADTIWVNFLTGANLYNQSNR